MPLIFVFIAFYERQVTQHWEGLYKANILALSNAYLLCNVPAYYETKIIPKNKLSNKT